MRLHRHDELVEAMAAARCRADGFAWGAISSTLQRDYLTNAAAALDALLEAAVRLDVGKKAAAFEYGSTWVADTARPLRPLPMDFSSIILRMETSDA